MSWQEDYQDDHCDGFPEVEEDESPEFFECAYCGHKFSIDDLNEFNHEFHKKHYIDKLCPECFKEAIEDSRE